MFRADAKKRYWALYVSESCAGERLRLAGFSSGRGVCARGGCSARHEGVVAAAGFLAGTSIFFFDCGKSAGSAFPSGNVPHGDGE